MYSINLTMKISTAIQRAAERNPEITEDLLRDALATLQGVEPNYIDSCTETELNQALESLGIVSSDRVVESGSAAMALPTAANDGIEIQDANPGRGAMGQVADTLSQGAADLRMSASEGGAALADEVAVAYAAAFSGQLQKNADSLQAAFESLTGNVFGSPADREGTAGKDVQARRERSSNSLNQFLM